jgi:hypothetical protein
MWDTASNLTAYASEYGAIVRISREFPVEGIRDTVFVEKSPLLPTLKKLFDTLATSVVCNDS